MVAEPEEAGILRGEAFVATLAVINARRLGQNNHGSNASNGSIIYGIINSQPYALEMGDVRSISL